MSGEFCNNNEKCFEKFGDLLPKYVGKNDWLS